MRTKDIKVGKLYYCRQTGRPGSGWEIVGEVVATGVQRHTGSWRKPYAQDGIKLKLVSQPGVSGFHESIETYIVRPQEVEREWTEEYAAERAKMKAEAQSYSEFVQAEAERTRLLADDLVVRLDKLGIKTYRTTHNYSANSTVALGIDDIAKMVKYAEEH